jgi:hypothetical protein
LVESGGGEESMKIKMVKTLARDEIEVVED